MRTEEKKPKKQPPVWKLVLGQILLTALVLCVFAAFHHVIPRWKQRLEGTPQPIGTVQRKTSPSPAPQSTSVPGQQSGEETSKPEPEIAEDTWQTRFAEHFSETPVWTENGYSSPTLSVTVTEYAHTEEFPRVTYYVADIYLTDIESFRTGFPESETYDYGERIARYHNAVVAINGDSMITQGRGLLIRNGEIYADQPNAGDLCVLYYDGTMEVYSPGSFTVEEILAREPFQCWQFGPSLLDENGAPLESFNISSELQDYHPRTAIGYYEPGHYCFVVVDGRNPGHSDGADMRILARIMSGLGCRCAYNLDGGASSMMILNGETVNTPSKTGPKSVDRSINDMLIIVEPYGEGA